MLLQIRSINFENYKHILRLSDIVIPNITEAKFLDLDDKKMEESKQKYIITSLEEDGKNFVRFYGDEKKDIPYEKIDIKVGGSGDLFDGLFIGYLLKDYSYEEAIKLTNDTISKILARLKEDRPKAEEIPIEKYLNLIEG